MADSIREKIAKSLVARLELILVSNGYTIDFGLNVNRAKKSYDELELPAVSLWLNQESAEVLFGNDARLMFVDIELMNVVDENETRSTDVLANNMIADIQRCLGTYDQVLMDLIEGLRETNTEPIYPDSGSNIISARLTYEIKYVTVRGDPYLQP